MIAGTLIFLIQTASGLFTLALLLRFYLQWARAPYRHALADFLQALTDFAVRPARRLIPGLWGLDFATLTLAWLTQIVELWLVLQLRGHEIDGSVGVLLLLAAVNIVRLLVYIIMVAVIVQAVLTWVAPYSPIMPLLNSMVRPWLRFFQRMIPPVGNVDLSPLFVVIVCQIILMLPLAVLDNTLARLL